MPKLTQKEIDALNKKLRGMSRETANEMAKNMGMPAKKKTTTKKVVKKKK